MEVFLILVLALVLALGITVVSSVLAGTQFIWYPIMYRLKGYKKVLLYDGEYSFNEEFTTWVKPDDSRAHQTAYRYNFARLGNVKLYKDGTAEYCGKYKWRYV